MGKTIAHVLNFVNHLSLIVRLPPIAFASTPRRTLPPRLPEEPAGNPASPPPAALPCPLCYGRKPSALWTRFGCCSSSVVEHSLGKGEVESSILSCSTINSSELSPVFFFESYPAATHMDQKISSRLSVTAVGKQGAIIKLSQRSPGSQVLKTRALNREDLRIRQSAISPARQVIVLALR
jgi:hypothetical protein